MRTLRAFRSPRLRPLRHLPLLLLGWTGPVAPVGAEFLLGGIQVNEPSREAWAEALRSAGMNAVAVTSYAKQGDWDSANLWWEDDREGVVAEVRAAREQGVDAVLVLRVALDHAFERNRFLWHGMIQPATEADLAEWFRRYREFVLSWAATAEREAIPILMIGAELNALASTRPLEELPALEEWYLNPEKQEERREKVLAREREIESRHLWLRGREDYEDLGAYLEARIAVETGWARQVAGAAALESSQEAIAAINRRRAVLESHWEALIASVREVYSGRLGYAANFDQYHEVGFWESLDLVGVNAYFPLRDRLVEGDDPLRLYPGLVDSWTAILEGIDAVRRREGVEDHPVLFTELGYTRRAEATLEPWADTGFSVVAGPEGEEDELVVWGEQPLAPRERALAVRALGEALDRFGRPILEGILWWKLSTEPAHHEIEAFLLVLGEDDPLHDALRLVRRRALAIAADEG